MAAKSFRLRFTFWLDICKSEEEEIAETIADLKQQRSFVSTIRDGIRLITDLRAGRMDVLFELFPWVRTDFLDYMSTLQPQSNEPNLALQQQITRLEKILLEQGNILDTRFGESDSRGPRKMNIPPIPAFEEDDSDLLFIAESNSASKATQNFLNSISRLQ